MSDVHDLLREPGRVSVSRAQLESALHDLDIERQLARSRGDQLAQLRLELDEARKELVRERARHRLEQAERVVEQPEHDPREYW